MRAVSNFFGAASMFVIAAVAAGGLFRVASMAANGNMAAPLTVAAIYGALWLGFKALADRRARRGGDHA